MMMMMMMIIIITIILIIIVIYVKLFQKNLVNLKCCVRAIIAHIKNSTDHFCDDT